jgi:hypothetical protein
MKEYIILFFIFVIGIVLPWIYVSSAPPLTSKYVMKATHEGKTVFTLTSTENVLDINAVGDKGLKDTMGLPDLYFSGKEEALSVEMIGRWDITAEKDVDYIELYLIESKKEEKANLSIKIFPTAEADIIAYIGGTLIYQNRTLNIMKDAEQFGLKPISLRDLAMTSKNRDTLINGVFSKYILPTVRALGWKLEWRNCTPESTPRGDIYTIRAVFSIDIMEKGELLQTWSGLDAGREKKAYFTISVSDIKEYKGYPYLLLRAFYKYMPIKLENNEPKFSCINETQFGYLERILDTYYRWFLGGGSSILRNYTDMVPGFWVQDQQLDCKLFYCKKLIFPRSEEIIGARRGYIIPYVSDTLREEITEEKVGELEGKISQSTFLSWLFNSLLISLVLLVGVLIVKRAR